MLTDNDMDLIIETRKEVYANRTHEITILIPQADGNDPISGEPIEMPPLKYVCDAVVTEITSNVNVDRFIDNGILIETGDALFHIDYDQLTGIGAEITNVNYDDESYEIINAANKGLGRLNRIELLGRVIT